MMKAMLIPLQNLVHLLYPATCESCSKPLVIGEKTICITCISQLLLFKGSFYSEGVFKRISQYGIEEFYTLLTFTKSSHTQRLLHKLKYDGKKDIGLFFGRKLSEIIPKETLSEAQLLIPVPIHAKKRRKRGYNQSAIIAEGLEEVTGIRSEERVLVKHRNTKSQTDVNRLSRWKNVSHSIALLEKELVKEKVVLLIDDVYTTGATAGHCVQLLKKAGARKVYVITVAVSI